MIQWLCDTVLFLSFFLAGGGGGGGGNWSRIQILKNRTNICMQYYLKKDTCIYMKFSYLYESNAILRLYFFITIQTA